MTTAFFRLWPNGQTTCSKPYTVVSNLSGGTPGALDATCTVLPVTLRSPLASGKSASVSMSFTDTVPSSWRNFRYGVSGDAFWIATPFPLLALTDDLGLHLEPFTSTGEPEYSMTSTWNVTLTLAAGLQAATTGTVMTSKTLADGRQQLSISAPAARDFGIAIGPYTITSKTSFDR